MTQCCRVLKGMGSKVDVILNKEAEWTAIFIGACEAVRETSSHAGIRGMPYLYSQVHVLTVLGVVRSYPYSSAYSFPYQNNPGLWTPENGWIAKHEPIPDCTISGSFHTASQTPKKDCCCSWLFVEITSSWLCFPWWSRQCQPLKDCHYSWESASKMVSSI